MDDAGIDITMIHLQDDSIEQKSYSEDEKVIASRTLKFNSEAKASINNFILQIIQDEHLDANVSTEYYVSNEDVLRKKLRELAIADSRENAELLALAAGKKIVGVDTIDMSNHRTRVSYAEGVAVAEECDCIFKIFSKDLSMPTRKLEESVEATWLLD